MGFLADILADALRHPVPGSTPDAGDGAPWEDDGAASPEWGGARAPRSADHAWEARTDSGDGAAPLEKVASVVPRGQGGTLAGGARVPAQSLPDPVHVLSRGAVASQASSRMPSPGPLPDRSVPEDGSTGAADRVPASPLASVDLLRRHAQGPATPPVFQPSGTRPEDVTGPARQGLVPEVAATRAEVEAPAARSVERAATEASMPGVRGRSTSAATVREAEEGTRADASVSGAPERAATARGPEARTGSTSFLSRALPEWDSRRAESAREDSRSEATGPRTVRGGQESSGPSAADASSAAHASAQGALGHGEPGPHLVETRAAMGAPDARVQGPGARREGAAREADAAGSAPRQSGGIPPSTLPPGLGPIPPAPPSTRASDPAPAMRPAAPAKAPSGARRDAAPAARPGTSSLTPPEPARPPVLPPRREPAEPRVHIGEVHVIITAPVAPAAPASSSAIPGHGSDLLNRHYLRNA
jgi:hypothetical protein